MFHKLGRAIRLPATALMTWISFGMATHAAADETPANEVVHIYSARQEALLAPLLEAFTAKTGIEYEILSGGADQLVARLEAEGINSPADVLITTDAGRLFRAKKAGVLQPVAMAALDDRVPAHFRDPDDYWVGLSVRARVLFTSRERVKDGAITTLAELANPEWKGRVCIRSSSNIYNQSLMASLIEAWGTEKAEAWARGVVANLARQPQGGDRDQIRAVAAGQCDVAVANTYYFGGLQSSDSMDDRDAADAVRLVFPDQDGRGAHVNVSGAGIAAHAPNPDAARALLDFLTSPEAQSLYATLNVEFPVVPGTDSGPIVSAWGPFKADDMPMAVLGERNAEAVMLFDRVGWR